LRKQVNGPVARKKIKSKRGVTLTELVATIALLSILAGASVAVIGVVMQSFQKNTNIALSGQEITQAQNLIHHTAEVAREAVSADMGNAAAFTPAEGDRRLSVTDGRLVMSEYNSSGAWEDYLPFDGLSKARFELREDSGGGFLLAYRFQTDKALSYDGGVTLNNVTAATPFTVEFETGGTAPLPGEPVSCIYFKMP